jgi:hypothetical protein
MDFYSRILHSLNPNKDRIWIPGHRLGVEIKGWPKNIAWTRTAALEFEGKINKIEIFDLEEYRNELQEALKNIVEGIILPTRAKACSFEIGNKSSWKKYQFLSKARTIAALCVLYDLEPHPRNDLELNIQTNLGLQSWPYNPAEINLIRTYGDPSKTADVLRNEGWPRDGQKPGLNVFRKKIGETHQQMYQLSRTEQILTHRKMRSSIPRKWRTELFKSQNFTCRICHNKYPADYLEPDH